MKSLLAHVPLPEDKTRTDRISMAFSVRMTMPPERLAQTRAAIEELVGGRRAADAGGGSAGIRNVQ